jgi:hypothetical protein
LAAPWKKHGAGTPHCLWRTFLTSTELDGATAPITLIQNWTPDAKK